MNRVLILPERMPEVREWILALLAGLAALSLAFFPTLETTLAVLGVIGAVAVFLRWQVALYLLAFSIPFSSLKEVRLGEVAVSATDLLVILLFISWLVDRAVHRELRLHSTPIFFPFLVFFSALALSMTNARSIPLSLKEMAKWLEAFGTFLIVYNYLTNRKQAALLVGCLLAAGVLEALVGLYQFFTLSGPSGFLIGGQYLRAYGTFNQPNPYAGYLGLLTPISLGLLVGALRRGMTLGSRRLALLVGVWGILSLAILLSLSRAAWLGYAAALFFVLTIAGRRFILPFIAAFLTAVLLLWNTIDFLPQQLTQRLFVVSDYFAIFDARRVTVTPENWAIVDRMATWQAAWAMFQSSPILGVGAGNFDPYYRKFSLPFWDRPPGHAHNYYLNLLAETGIVGLLGYLLFWVSVFLLCFGSLKGAQQRQARREVGKEPRRSLLTLEGVALGVVGMVVALTLHNLFDNLFVQGMAVQFGMTLGLLGLMRQNKMNEDSTEF